MKTLKIALLVVVVLYLLVLLATYLLQEKIIFPAEPLRKDYPFNLTAEDREVFIAKPNGDKINGILYKRAGNKGVVLYLHGNAGHLSSWQHMAPEILEHKKDLLLIDYGGYGKSEGKFSEEGFYTDGKAAYNFLLTEGYKPEDIIIYGRSIGTGIATQLATTQKTGGLILESPYCSIPALGREKMPFLLPGLLLKYQFNNLEKAPGIKVPVLILHGTDDSLIPAEHGKKLYAAFTTVKTLVLIPGGHHNDLSEFPEKAAALQAFLSSH
ncbi:MAG: alpha/beta fold hydrolase [Chitinophagales bacterium]